VPDIAAKLAAEIVAHEKVDDAVFGLRLERDLPAGLLEHRAQQRGQHQRLGQQPLDKRRIIVVGEDRVERPGRRAPAVRAHCAPGS
jgi:hypothetical protein